MNPKITKIVAEIGRMKAKIADYQNRLRELERQKTELENADIVATVRGIDIPPEQLAEFIRAFTAGKQSLAVPDMDQTAQDDETTEREDLTVEK